MTKLEIATEIVAVIGGDAEQLAKSLTSKTLKAYLATAKEASTDEEKETLKSEIVNSVQAAIRESLKSDGIVNTIEKLGSDKKVELVDVITKNNVVTFVYSDESTEEVKFKKGYRDIVNTIIRNARNELTIASKPEPNKEIIQRIRNLTYVRICRIALVLDNVVNDEAKALFNAPISEILAHPAVDAIVIKNIADSYCEVEKIGRL